MTTAFPGMFLILGSVANVLKGIAGLTSGACRASINNNMAIADNLGDVTAKLSAQGMLAYVLGTSLGVSMSVGLTGASVPALYALFVSLATVHLFCSYRYPQSTFPFSVYFYPFVFRLGVCGAFVSTL